MVVRMVVRMVMMQLVSSTATRSSSSSNGGGTIDEPVHRAVKIVPVARQRFLQLARSERRSKHRAQHVERCHPVREHRRRLRVHLFVLCRACILTRHRWCVLMLLLMSMLMLLMLMLDIPPGRMRSIKRRTSHIAATMI